MATFGIACLWFILCVGATFLLAGFSPHGMAAFVLVGGMLGSIGAVGSTFRLSSGIRRSIAFGSGYGLAAYLITQALVERRLALPHDSYQVLLALYAVMVATLVDYAVGRVVRRLRTN